MIKLTDSFFEDEIREGFYVPAAIKQCWGAEIEVLNEIDRVCKKHGLKYFVCWGTLLGAIRHGGMIPWDDDFDIVMLREDYDKFLSVWKGELPEGFDVINYKSHPDHIYFISNVVGKSRICFEKDHLEKFHNFPYIAGIDIYTLDNMSRDEDEEKRRMKVADYITAAADGIFDGKIKDQKAEECLLLIENTCNVRVPRNLKDVDLRIFLYSVAEDYFRAVPAADSDTVTQIMPWGIEGRPYVFKRSDFAYQVELPFETGTIPAIPKYTMQAELSYGNYLEIYKDVAGHEYPFFDEQKRQLESVLDFKMPEFRFSPEMLERPVAANESENYKSICLNMIKGMEDLCHNLCGCKEEKVNVLSEIQQAAIDLGTFMEEVKGEGYDIVADLERLCEEVYMYSQTGDEESYVRMTELVHNAGEKIRTRKEAVFLPFKAQYFDTMRSLYEEALNDPDTDVYVVPIPYYYKNYDGTLRNKQYDLNRYDAGPNLYDCEKYDFGLRHPDKIVFQYPYDEFNEATGIPPYFYSRNLRQYTDRLIYVPWFVTDDFDDKDARAVKNMRYYVNMPGVIYSDEIYVQTKNIRKKYVRTLCRFAGNKYRKLFEKKINVLEDINKGATEKREAAIKAGEVVTSWKKSIIYAPDFSTMLRRLETIEAEYASDEYKDGKQSAIRNPFEKLEEVLNTFSESARETDIEFIWFEPAYIKEYLRQAHPDIYSKYMDIYEKCEKEGCVKIVHDGCRIRELAQSASAFYGDTGWIMRMFQNTKRPIMVQNYDV